MSGGSATDTPSKPHLKPTQAAKQGENILHPWDAEAHLSVLKVCDDSCPVQAKNAKCDDGRGPALPGGKGVRVG